MKRPGKSLRQLSQAVQGVQVGALPIPRQRFAVQLDTVNCLQTGNIQITEGETGRDTFSGTAASPHEQLELL